MIFLQLPGPLVLQVSKVRNVSAPKANEESGTAPRMLRVTLTDGTNCIQALEVQNIKPIRYDIYQSPNFMKDVFIGNNTFHSIFS